MRLRPTPSLCASSATPSPQAEKDRGDAESCDAGDRGCRLTGLGERAAARRLLDAVGVVALEPLSAAVAIEVDVSLVGEHRIAAVGVGEAHVDDERGSVDPLVHLVSLVGARHVVNVVVDVLEVGAVPVVGPCGEPGLHASVLEANRHDLLALRKIEVGDRELTGLGGAQVLCPEPPALVGERATVVSQLPGILLREKPGVVVPVREGGVGAAPVDVVHGSETE